MIYLAFDMSGLEKRIGDALEAAIKEKGVSFKAYLKEPDEKLEEVSTEALAGRFSMVRTDGLAAGKPALRIVV